MFDQLSKHDVTGTSIVEFELPEAALSTSAPTPVLILAPATDATPAYQAALLARLKDGRRGTPASKITPEFLAKSRDEDRVLFAKHILKGWRNLCTSDGEPAEFSEETAAKLIQSLPDHLFDEIRAFAMEPSNFTAQPDTEGTAGN